MKKHDISSSSHSRTLNILGIRGIPAAHGGFETFAARLSGYLRERGWSVTVYCQHEASDPNSPRHGSEDIWNGIRRIHVISSVSGPLGTIEFDWWCVRHVLKEPGIDLILGYNTAVFALVNRIWGRTVIMNMDGIEWKRAKWNWAAKMWFRFNEIIGSKLCNVPIADHPEIARHLKRYGCNRTIVIPYGADVVTEADASLVESFGIEPDRYFISIARIEPENSILEIVQGFANASTGLKLVILGKFTPETNPYHAKVERYASKDVLFLGAIYNPKVVSALRLHARAYIHGHQVGGTNPSLVEALGVGSAVIAHDNRFNRWVAGPLQFYFADPEGCAGLIERIAHDEDAVKVSRAAARKRHAECFLWSDILARYEEVLQLAR
jgi:glycosyltransferase involved in cell wall biosynthesis